MQNVLMEKLWTYIVHNNPELMISLQASQSVTNYLNDKVNAVLPLMAQLLNEGKTGSIVEELCMNALTEDLKPSKYQYIRSVMKEEFPREYEVMRGNGTLTYEIVSLIEACKDIFNEFDFKTGNEDSRQMRHSIIWKIHDHMAW